MSKPYKQIYHGKNLQKTNKGSKPKEWIPNTYIDTYNAYTGRFRSRRKFGKNGYATMDMEVGDEHRPYDHVHDYVSNKRNEIPRLPNKKEEVEFRKAKVKRRFLDD